MKNILVLLSVWALLTCSKNGNIAGTIDETGTGKPCAAVMGLVVYSNSNPVVGAAVNLYNQNNVQKIVVPLQKRLNQSIDRNTQTNINGIFRFDSVDTGKYYVDINDHDSLGALVPAIVRPQDTLVTVNAVLQLLGAIQGKIDTSLVSPNTKTYIYVVEAQKQVAVDSAGNFVVTNLPPYNYTLQVIHDTVVVTSPLDTAKVTVTGGDTVHVGNSVPQVLVGVDTAAGVAPCTVKVIYKVSDPSGNAVSMRLNYGDGNADTLTQMSGSRSHVFIDSGSFKILLIAQDGNGGIGRDSVIVGVHKNSPPIVQVAVDTATGFAPFTVKAVYKITDPDGDAVSARLIYGDGSIDTLLQMSGNKSHTYIQSGTYLLSMVAKDSRGGVGKDSAIITVEGTPPTTPSLIAPSDGASGIPISLTLIWNKILNAVSYDLQVATDTGFINIVNGDTSIVDTFRIENGFANSSIYYWRIRAKNSYGISPWSIRRSFTTIIAAPQAPTLTSPVDGATGLSLAPTLIWSAVSGAATYHVQVSTVNTFGTIVIEDSTLTTGTKALSGLTNGTTYYWRVQSKNAGGASALTSPISFTTVVTVPQAPTLTSPLDGTTGLSLTPTLAWSTVSGASTYHVQVSMVNTFTTIVLEDSTLTMATKALTGLVNSTTYYWRVQSKNAGGVGAWTSPWSFTTIGLSSWTVRSISTNEGLRCVAWGNNKFVTAGGSDSIFASPDGIMWTGQITGGINGFNGIAFGNNLYVAVGQPCVTCGTGSNGAIVTSPDAITWTSRTSGTPDWLPAVTWGNNEFIAVEWWLHISTDGITWTDNYSTNNGGQDHLDGIVWGDNQFVAVGRTGLMYTSPDGNTWTKRTAITSNGLTSVTWANNKFVAVGANGTIITSPDGVTWTARTSGVSNNLSSITWGNNQFIAVGTTGTILSSPDGITWTGSVSGTINDLGGVCYGNNQFVTVGNSGTVLTLP